jgi:uncharacterized Zn finger protein (UPF0148 family)
MGSHSWYEKSSYCGFENLLVSSYKEGYFDIICPICGYSRWTEEKIPQAKDVELAKRTLTEMSTKERENLVELYHEENISLIVRLKGKLSNQE